MNVKVSIIEVFDLDQFPGWCKVILTDANGVDHAFDDKTSSGLDWKRWKLENFL